MSEQDFREPVLSAIDDLKRKIERMDDRTDKRLTTVGSVYILLSKSLGNQ